MMTEQLQARSGEPISKIQEGEIIFFIFQEDGMPIVQTKPNHSKPAKVLM